MSRSKTKNYDRLFNQKCIGPELAGVPSGAVFIHEVVVITYVPGLFKNDRLLANS